MTESGKGLELAIVGMAGRFPGAPDVDTFWRNLCAGVSGIRDLSDDELLASGVAAELLTRPDYVRKAAVIDDEDSFDAEYFGYSPAEAAIIDPQQRLFLQTAAAALQNAGYDSRRYPGRIGVFGSASANTYLLNNVWPNEALHRTFSPFTLLLGGEKDYLATRTAYKLDLTGPAMAVQSACSSSLVAVHLAAQALIAGECDMALAGGVTVRVPQRVGHLAHESGIGSPDGLCRPFDADGQGTITGNGVGMVLLKPLDDAIAAGDTVVAVLRGSAVTNDGAAKVGFSAPSVNGQSAAIRAALDVAEIDSGSIGYVEAHGTGTPLGDPIEVAALTQAFGPGPAAQWCAIGSVKSNIGHLDAAAGVVGLIKAALCVRDGVIPPSLNFDRPNPHIPFAEGPFFVNTRLRSWPLDGVRRACVNSMGIGGTNAHVVLEQPPTPPLIAADGSREFVLVSARTADALEQATEQLAGRLESHPELPLADVAWTTQVGRPELDHRRAVSVRGTAQVPSALRDAAAGVSLRSPRGSELHAAWLFSGQGSQFPGMGAELYRENAAFRAALDDCADILRAPLGVDIRELLHGAAPAGEEELLDTRLAQPVLFSMGYAMAEALRAYGLRPGALLGHSVGEYVAAQQAGILSLPDALGIVEARGRIVSGLRRGAMLTVPLPPAEVAGMLPASLAVAAVNGPALCTVAGPGEAIDELAALLAASGTTARRLRVSHAFHTAAMDEALDPLRVVLQNVALRPPTVPVVSNVTGEVLTPAQATSPEYWVRHLREPVLFSDGVRTLLAQGHRVFLDVGAHPVLGPLVRHHAEDSVFVATLNRHTGQGDAELAGSVARLWTLGVSVDWLAGRRTSSRQRIPLPTYPFERRRHWVDPPSASPRAAAQDPARPVAGAEPRTAGPGPAAAGDPPSTTRTALAAVWAELTGVSEVGPADDFFALGGHSLLATQLFARVRELFDLSLPMRTIFDHPELGALADHIDRLRPRSNASPAKATESAPTAAEVVQEAYFPLTSSQQNLWFLQRVAPTSNFYALGNRITLQGPLDLDAFEAALRELVQRHAILRTTFPLVARRPVQHIRPAAESAVEVVDARLLPDSEVREIQSAAERTCLSRVRDLTANAPFAAVVIRRSEVRHDVVLVLHHIAADYWASALLLTDLFGLYTAMAAGQPAPSAPLPLAFANFAVEERKREAEPEFQRLIEHWKGVFRTAPPPLQLPGQGSRPASPAHAGAWQPVHICAETGLRTTNLARSVTATPFMVLLAAFAVQLHALSGEQDLCIGAYAGNRASTELESVIGLFASTIALRMDVSPELTFRQLVEHVKAVCLDAFDHSGVSVDQLVSHLELPRQAGRNPLFQAMLVLESAPHRDPDVPGLDITVEAIETGTAKLDLLLTLFPDGSGYRGFLEYSRDLFSAETAAGLAAGLVETLRLLVGRPDEQLAHLLRSR